MQQDSLIPDPTRTPPEILFFDSTIAGITPMIKDMPYDEIISRPQGMQGYILNLTIEGEGLIKEGEQSFVCRKGDMLLFPPHVVHYYQRNPSAPNWYHQWIYFFPRSYWQPALNFTHALHALHLDNDDKIGEIGYFHVSDELFETFKNLFLEVIKRYRSQNHCSQLLSYNFIEQILMRRWELSQEPEEIKNTDPRVSRACLYIQETLSNPNFNVDDVANHINLSASRISHLFEQTLNSSIIKWRDRERFKLSCMLLINSSLKVEQVAIKSGFNDTAYFFKFFKRYSGQTPAQYRNTHLK